MKAQKALALEASGDQSHLSRFFSKLCWCPVNTFVHRLAGAYGLRSHILSVLSCTTKLRALTQAWSQLWLKRIEIKH